jgi:ferredoxin
VAEEVRVRVEQDLCTGDGLCVQLAPEIFEFDVDGLAYVKDASGALLPHDASTSVPVRCLDDVVEAAHGCPGDCIFVERADGSLVAGPRDASGTAR